ncbi:response regulator transcription factor [Fulvivirgaceae bacterium PWU4]|uniref:Response regulator transcription factor n=1 Tax=Chryseosolibacter histidini TaxID=2782349 RepID=A0AAP2DPU1_9BACT|nr:response regulator transcription factor [Chryseosolibacter histidini]MBT1699349.1 response regulator transcription factor [Chryseosolibacter histidini]
MSNKIGVLLVDDEAMVRQGFKALLSTENSIKAIYEAGNASEFKKQLATVPIDVILLDIRLKDTNGLELMEVIKKSAQQPKVIAVTGLDGAEMIINLLKAGVNGIVHKLDGFDEVLKAIKTVMLSDCYFPPNILKIIQDNLHRWEKIHSVPLTAQEKDILRALADGQTTKEIAPQLKVTLATAETYRIRLMRKVGVQNTAGLLAYAFRNGIL